MRVVAQCKDLAEKHVGKQAGGPTRKGKRPSPIICSGLRGCETWVGTVFNPLISLFVYVSSRLRLLGDLKAFATEFDHSAGPDRGVAIGLL